MIVTESTHSSCYRCTTTCISTIDRKQSDQCDNRLHVSWAADRCSSSECHEYAHLDKQYLKQRDMMNSSKGIICKRASLKQNNTQTKPRQSRQAQMQVLQQQRDSANHAMCSTQLLPGCARSTEKRSSST
eukprot:3519-Heterococcus_DN1.PRE.4